MQASAVGISITVARLLDRQAQGNSKCDADPDPSRNVVERDSDHDANGHADADIDRCSTLHRGSRLTGSVRSWPPASGTML
jgi:ABC-type nitrate/sulfonate/bicarbonate transport system substrate-binding protein